MSLTKLLIIEDHPVMGMGTKSILEKVPCIEIVGIATTGEEGVKLSAKLKPSIVILDLSLPDEQGIDVACKIKHFQPEIKIIVFTGHDYERYSNQFANIGISGFIPKKAEPIVMVRIVESVVQGYTMMPSGVFSGICKSTLDRPTNSIRSILKDIEFETLELLIQGMTNQGISKRICRSERSVENYIANIKYKLGAESRTAIVSAYLKMVSN